MSSYSRRRILRRCGLLASAGAAGCVDSLAGPSPEERVDDHRSELRQLADVATAVEDGYRTTGRYVRTSEGVLGTPFVNPGVRELDPTRPNAVLFDLTDRGTYEAMGFKWFVPAHDRDEPPSLFGKEFEGPRDGSVPAIPEHYALHVWLFRDNPRGLFATYNSAVSPAPLVDEVETVREGLGAYLLGADAQENGYENTEQCVATGDGGYGIPFVRRDGDSSGGTDPSTPPVLTYRLTESWSYQLIGAEWYVPASEVDEPPSMFGRRFHESMAGHGQAFDQPDHYGMHAWLFFANPAGMFEPFNSALSC